MRLATGTSSNAVAILKDAKACRRLGDYLLADSPSLAQQAYARGCQAETQAQGCGADLQRRMRELTRDRAACEQRNPVACARVLRHTAVANHDAAYEAAQRICEIRGLEEYYAHKQMAFAFKLRRPRTEYDACGLFLVARAASDPEGKSAFKRAAPPEGVTDHGGRVELASIGLHYASTDDAPAPERIIEEKKLIAAQLAEGLELAGRCYDFRLGKEPSLDGQVTANFIIDKLGDTLELRAGGPLSDMELPRCIASAVVPERFTGIQGGLDRVVRVEVSLRLLAPSHGDTPARADKL